MLKMDISSMMLVMLLPLLAVVTSAPSTTGVHQKKRNTNTPVHPDNHLPDAEEVAIAEADQQQIDAVPQQHEEMDEEYVPWTPDAFPPCVSVDYLTTLKDRFQTQIDRNDDGKATFEEMRDHLRVYNKHVSNSFVRAFVARRDLNGNNVLEFVPEYVKNIVTPDYSPENAEEWFHLDDTNGDGYVTAEELIAISMRLGKTREESKQQVASYYMSNDMNKDGKLSWDEYKVIYGQ